MRIIEVCVDILGLTSPQAALHLCTAENRRAAESNECFGADLLLANFVKAIIYKDVLLVGFTVANVFWFDVIVDNVKRMEDLQVIY
jgi:hypothetical protein